MKKTVLLFLSVVTLQSFANSFGDLLIPNNYTTSFNKAYAYNPVIPKGVLEAVAFSQTRFFHLDGTQEPSCIGYPQAFGVMGLTEDGKGYFRNNLIYISQLSGYSVSDIKTDAEKNILAFAKAFSTLQTQLNITSTNLQDYQPIFIALSELPLTNNIGDDYAMNSHLYQLYWFMAQPEFQNFYNIPNYFINLKTVFGANYNVLSAKSITVFDESVINETGQQYRSSGATLSILSVDYPPALWAAAASCNQSSRGGTAITMVAIHDVEGSYAGCISWFQNCASSASAHYVIRSSDGQVTQMVLESGKAWHIGSENPYTLGIEHEGYNNVATWYTTNMLTSSAALVRDMCTDYGISPLRCYFGPGCSGTTQQCAQGTCVKIKGHQMFPNQTHNDPGPYWNWEKFYKLLNNTPTITTLTASGGTFYDTGGASALYSNDERKLWLFQPAGATSVSMNFTSFAVENNYDFMFIYDGATTSSPLIGKYTNNVSPGNINSTGTSLLVEFRSDCATALAGWAATYTSNAVPTGTTAPGDVIIPTTLASSTGIWQTANFTETYTDADNIGIDKAYYQVTDYNGTEWRANYTRGFFSDNFDVAIHPEWTVPTTTTSGTWGIVNNALVQSVQSPSATAYNTNIYAALTQTLSNRYLYHFKGKIDGTGANRRAGFHFFVDNPTATNRGNSYFVYFRLDVPRIQIYKTVNDVIYLKADSVTNVSLVAGQWYDFKVIFDRTTGKIQVYKDNTLAATWTDNTPLVAGDVAPLANGSYISFRSGECVWSLDEIKVFRSRATTTPVSLGIGNAFDVRYQNPNPTTAACRIKSIVNDAAGNLSAIDVDDVNIDWTTPNNITTINDGKVADINFVVTSDSLSANWPASTDPHSSVVRYWFSIGTTPGATNTMTWTSNWANTNGVGKNLMLVNNQVYYTNVKAENGAGLFSGITSSNGQTVTISTGIEDFKESNLISVYPNPFTNSFDVSLNLATDSDIELTLIDALGKEVAYYQSKEGQGVFTKNINTSTLGLANGTYLIKVMINKEVLYKKMIKQ